MGPVDILLVEDNPLDTKATFSAARKLHMAGEIRVVASGQDALDHLRSSDASSRAGIVLLDLNLPGKDGHDVLREIRSDPVLKSIPVVVLTGSSDSKDIQSAYSLGANAYVTKPSDMDGWLTVISTINDFWLTVVQLPNGDAVS